MGHVASEGNGSDTIAPRSIRVSGKGIRQPSVTYERALVLHRSLNFGTKG